MIRRLLSAFQRAPRPDLLELEKRLRALELSEVGREALLTDQLEKLGRLVKRLNARMGRREAEDDSEAVERLLAERRRLNGMAR